MNLVMSQKSGDGGLCMLRDLEVWASFVGLHFSVSSENLVS